MEPALEQAYLAMTEKLLEVASHIDAIYEAQKGEGSERAGLCPPDLEEEEFTATGAASAALSAPGTVVSHAADDSLHAVPHQEAYHGELVPVAAALREAAAICPASVLADHPALRAEGLLHGGYRASDAARVKA